MKQNRTNKAIGSDISNTVSELLEQGINVNINIETVTLVKLIFFSIILTIVISGTSYGLHYLKTH